MTDSRDTPSKYVEEAKALCDMLSADAVLLLVVNGNRGSGGSSAAKTPAGMLELASALRAMADYQEQHARDILGRG